MEVKTLNINGQSISLSFFYSVAKQCGNDIWMASRLIWRFRCKKNIPAYITWMLKNKKAFIATPEEEAVKGQTIDNWIEKYILKFL